MTTVFANGLSIIHQGDGMTHTCPIPDVCKTPTPAGPVPVPYVNIAMSSNLTAGSTTVKIAGSPVALESSNIPMSSGDEAGSAGGVISGKFAGKLTWTTSSPNVKFEGKGVCRFTDVAQHNGNTGNTFTLSLGTLDMPYPFEAGDTTCPNCGKPIAEHDPASGFPIETGEQSDQAVVDFANAIRSGDTSKAPQGMAGALIVKDCANPADNGTLLAVAGRPAAAGKSKGPLFGWEAIANTVPGAQAAANPMPSNPATVRTARGGTVQVTQVADSNPPLQCAAQKLVQTALEKGCKPVQMTEAWIDRREKTTQGHRIQSCPTCKDNIARMLCPNPPQE
ncbi:MAG TPA: DUF4150 domain-containing protein [Enhygromyxa sp.]|nr:DUF4150 domain-containing protein [Enhygromyxa sp.]